MKSESVFSYFDATKNYIEKHGRPLAFYSDKHGVFRVNKNGDKRFNTAYFWGSTIARINGHARNFHFNSGSDAGIKRDSL